MYLEEINLPDLVYKLEEKHQIQLAIDLIEIGQPIWNEYTLKNNIAYTDSVVGMHHSVSKGLIKRAIKLFKGYLKNNGAFLKKINKIQLKLLFKEYLEPRVALIDDDLELPKNVGAIFLAGYYLTEFFVEGKAPISFETNIYTAIEYATDAIITSGIKTESEIKNILNTYEKRMVTQL